MKENRKHRDPRRRALVIGSLVVLLALAIGGTLGYQRLRDLWLEQCVITDMAQQVSITEGKMVKADVLAENFGLRKGANLALIDFAERRKEILEKVPNLRAVNVVRHLPKRVEIVAEERVPVARMNVRGRKSVTGRVVDAEGVVFVWQRGTDALPTIRESSSAGTAVGARLVGRAAAALALAEKARDPDFSELGILEIDATHPDYLIATLGNYSTAKIAWDDMDEPTPASDAALARTLRHLTAAIRTQLATGTVVWNATDSSGRIYADRKGNAQ